MQQSFETPASPPLPIRALTGDWGVGGLSPQIYSLLAPRNAGNLLEVIVFASPTSGISEAVSPWSAVFIFVPHSNFTYIIITLIVHILQSVLTITINNCQYLVSVSRKYVISLLWNVHLDRTDFHFWFHDDFDRRLAHVNWINSFIVRCLPLQ